MTLLFLSLIAALPVQPPGKCVLDEAHALEPAAFAQLEASCEALDKSGDGQIEIVITDDFRGADKEEFANTLFHAWQIGHKGKDDGVLVVLSPKMRKWRIEIGYGIEGAITDAQANEIGETYGVPEWKHAAWGVGLTAVVAKIVPMMHAEAATTISAPHGNGPYFGAFFILLLLVLLVVCVAFGLRQARLEELREREREREEERKRRLKTIVSPHITVIPRRSVATPVRPHRRDPDPTPAPIPVPIPVVVDDSPSFSSSPSYDSSPPFDSGGGFDGGGGGDSGGGGAGGDF